jgi:hypothetical protein
MAEIIGWGVLGNTLITLKCVFPAIALESDQADASVNGQWIQVDEIIDLQQINGKRAPMVSKPRIKPVEAPAVLIYSKS